MSGAQQKEQDAFFALLVTFDLNPPVLSLADLSDGAVLFEILSVVDADYFRQPARSPGQPQDNWVLRFSALKRLYRLMTQYLTDVLHQPATSLVVPDLQAMAKDHDPNPTLAMCRLALVIAVQSEKNKMIIEKIQQLREQDQHCLMKAIEQIITKLRPSSGARSPGGGSSSMTDDDHYYAIQSERSRVLMEKETLESVYQNLLEGHRTLQSQLDDTVAEKDEALNRLRELRREVDDKRNERADGMMRAEIDRLRSELQKSEDNLGNAEVQIDKNTRTISDLQHRVDDLQHRADEAVKLKDQLDEYKHAADKLQKTENVMEKYKKKLEESADLRRRIKNLEEQNASLVDKNASLEEEYRKVSAFKPLLDSYKHQISELETRNSERTKEMDTLKFELEQARTLLKISEEEHVKDSEALDLFQERIRELELTTVRSPRTNDPKSNGVAGNMTEFTEEELIGHANDEDDVDRGLSGELDDALSGRTMTDLKLEIRKLKRELDAAKSNQADNSRILVLENLLEDSNRLKARYEEDYLTTHREKLVLQKSLEDIRSGKAMGDGAEAAIALRLRLNETVAELDALKLDHADLEVNFKSQADELVIAKSDLTLVNKDQLEILASLRESVKSDKAEVEEDNSKLRQQVKDLSDKTKMQLEQINGLLMEKVNLQSEGIGQREKMLERERNFSDLRLSVNSKDIPQEVKARLLQLQEQLASVTTKLTKAKAFIKTQDKLFKADFARSDAGSPRTIGDSDGQSESQLKLKDEELDRLRKSIQDMTIRYEKEQRLTQGVILSFGAERSNANISTTSRAANGTNTCSWLMQQRKTQTRALRQ